MTSNTRACGVDVHKIYTATNQELLELVTPRNVHFINTHDWFKIIADQLSTIHYKTTPHKIKNIYYGKSGLTPIERIHLEDLARQQAKSQPDTRQLSLLEGAHAQRL